MNRWILFFTSMLICEGLRAEEGVFFAVQPVESHICGCEFNESLRSANEGSYGAGPRVLVIAPNEKRPFALANFGKGDIKLEPIERTDYECMKGNTFSPSWKVGDIIVQAHLTVDSPGEEACWFKGTLSLKKNANIQSINIKGACGC